MCKVVTAAVMLIVCFCYCVSVCVFVCLCGCVGVCICACAFRLQALKSDGKTVITIITYVFPTLSARAVPQLEEFVKRYSAPPPTPDVFFLTNFRSLQLHFESVLTDACYNKETINKNSLSLSPFLLADTPFRSLDEKGERALRVFTCVRPSCSRFPPSPTSPTSPRVASCTGPLRQSA